MTVKWSVTATGKTPVTGEAPDQQTGFGATFDEATTLVETGVKELIVIRVGSERVNIHPQDTDDQHGDLVATVAAIDTLRGLLTSGPVVEIHRNTPPRPVGRPPGTNTRANATENREKVRAILKEDPATPVAEVARRAGISWRAAARHVDAITAETA